MPNACCKRNGLCQENLTLAQCQQAGGGYYPNKSCAQITCIPLTSCCKAEGTCQEGLTLLQCNHLGGTFHVELACPEISCQSRDIATACCDDDGNCWSLWPKNCLDQNYAVQPAHYLFDDNGNPIECGDFTCLPTPDAWACCIAGECKSYTSRVQCLADGGLFYDHETCEHLNAENPPRCSGNLIPGCCCKLNDTGIVTETRAECEGPPNFGLFWPGAVAIVGGQRVCNGADCTKRACCLPHNGGCVNATPFLDHSFNPPKWSCGGEDVEGIPWRSHLCGGPGGAPIECGTQACCIPDIGCLNLSHLDCQNAGGVEQGDGTQCSFPEVHCEDPFGAACCLSDGRCLTRHEKQCYQSSGYYRRGEQCNVNDPHLTCPKTACCLADGSCFDSYLAECNTRSGSWTAGKTCEETTCSADDIPRTFDPVGYPAPSRMKWGLDLCQWAMFEPWPIVHEEPADGYARMLTIHPVRAVEPDWTADQGEGGWAGEPCGYHWGEKALGTDSFVLPHFCSQPYHGQKNYDQTTDMLAFIERRTGIAIGPTKLPLTDDYLEDGFAMFGGLYHTPYWIEAQFDSQPRICGEEPI